MPQPQGRPRLISQADGGGDPRVKRPFPAP